MSRSGYVDDLDPWDLIKWRGRVSSAIRGNRGQLLLRDLLAALDAMPKKALIRDELETVEGDVCALGAVGVARGLDMSALDPSEPDDIADALNIATPLAKEIAYFNDEVFWSATPEQRWQRMRDWVAEKIKAA